MQGELERTPSGVIILERNTLETPKVFRPANGVIQTYKAGELIGEDESPLVHFPDIPGQVVIEGDFEDDKSRIIPSNGYLITVRPTYGFLRRKVINFFWGNNLQVDMDPADREAHTKQGLNPQEFLDLGRDLFMRQWRAKIMKHGITVPTP